MNSQTGAISKNVVITGAGQGLGRAMALGLLDAGHRVISVDIDPQKLDETLSIASGRGHSERATSFAVDLSANGSVATIIDRADEIGGIDILINNAGVGPAAISKSYMDTPPKFDDLSDEMVHLFFNINAISPLLLCIHAARHMRKQGWGRIVNITTSMDSMTRRGYVPYGGTKASLEAHSKIMAQDLEGSGVTLNVLVPGGPADTPMIPIEAGFDRSQLIKPEALVAPLLWLIADSPAPPNGKRVIAATWTPDCHLTTDDLSVSSIGWPDSPTRTIFPQKLK